MKVSDWDDFLSIARNIKSVIADFFDGNMELKSASYHTTPRALAKGSSGWSTLFF
jgi:hypothetical protein